MGLLVAVRRSKTNPDGDPADVRFVKGDVARALRALRARRGAVEPADRVVGLSAQAVSERFAGAARAAGIEPRLTAHSGRVGLATELAARGASAHDVMRAGNWKTVRMVAHYSAGSFGRTWRRRALPVSAGGSVKTPAAVQLLLPEMDGIAGFYEARTDRVLCLRCAGTPTPAGIPIPEPDCGDLHCSRCRQPLRAVNRRDKPASAPGLFA